MTVPNDEQDHKSSLINFNLFPLSTSKCSIYFFSHNAFNHPLEKQLHE